jgi:hypothetical protein
VAGGHSEIRRGRRLAFAMSPSLRLNSRQVSGLRRSLPLVLLLLVMLPIAVLGGMATAVVGVPVAMLIAGIVFGTAAFLLPLPALVIGLFVASFVVTGQIIYFARIDRALWLPFLLGMLLFVRLPVDVLVARRQLGRGGAARKPQGSAGLTAFTAFLLVYFGTALAASAANTVTPLQLFVTSKEYIFLWSVFVVLALGLVAMQHVERIWLWLPWLVVLQVPIILYQRFVVAPGRAARAVGAEWDAIVGAFGGNPQGGGSSGAMGIFSVFTIVFVVALWRSGRIGLARTVVLLLAALLSIALAEVKFAILLLPVAFAALFLREILRKPIQGFGALMLSLVLAATVFGAYRAQFQISQQADQTPIEYFQAMFTSSVDGDFVNLRTGEIGRVASIRFWADENADSVPELLLGHGLGASRIGDLVVGDAARKHPQFNLGRSSLALLLWEVGLIGTLAIIGALLLAWRRAHLLAHDARLSPLHRAFCGGSAVVIVLVLAGFAYNTDFMVSHQIQLLLMLAMGNTVMLSRQLAGQAKALPPVQQARMARALTGRAPASP